MDNTRFAATGSYSLTTSESTTPDIDVSNYSAAQIHVPAGSPITTLTFYSLAKLGDTPLPMYDSANSAVTQTVAASQANDLKSIAGVSILRLKVNAAGSVTLVLKS